MHSVNLLVTVVCTSYGLQFEEVFFSSIGRGRYCISDDSASTISFV